jgi:septal ring factor EnvC (AmiA/AmiB activator)
MQVRLLITALLMGIWVLGPMPSFAERNVKAELKEKEQEHQKLVKKSKEISSEVGVLKQKLINRTKSLRKTEETVSSTESKLKSLRKKRSQYLEELYKDQKKLGGMVTAAQRYKRTSTSQMLLQSEPVDAARAALVLKSVIPALNKQTALVKGKLAEIEKVESAISKQMEIKSREYKEINAQQKELSKLLEKRQELYKKTEAERRAQEDEVKKLAKEARSLEDLVLKIKSKLKSKSASTRALPPGMVLPVQGSILTGFGETDDLGGKSKGISLTTRKGATAITPLQGTVKFAGPFQKFKHILIVEHPGGYHSLIAGLGRIDTVVGASLSAGEPVGTTSSAPVYYELRQNGDPINPEKLLSAQRKQRKT